MNKYYYYNDNLIRRILLWTNLYERSDQSPPPPHNVLSFVKNSSRYTILYILCICRRQSPGIDHRRRRTVERHRYLYLSFRRITSAIIKPTVLGLYKIPFYEKFTEQNESYATKLNWSDFRMQYSLAIKQLKFVGTFVADIHKCEAINKGKFV